MKFKSQRDARIELINIIYAHELLNEKLDINQIFSDELTLNNKQIKSLEFINQNYDFYIKIISHFIKEGWNWERISALHRAILINATNEMFNNLAAKVAINEAIEITKLFFDDESYKMINAILQNVYKHLISLALLDKKISSNKND
ncbi:transcription antitermination protein NusB [Mycoplasma sp. 744]|uniref:transcription antitermination protein NusB n=1 Tax=unclassified Mycoplasma TaxID=2683645 RepID=UPI00211CDFAC|nr:MULTISPECIES: transcription antitermination protein NusB [unclassified Mycoplasma]MEA4115460.1 transcription antitermination protein NusB [Mycoplasma sp. 744]UUM18969.1 transcription antitermination protein NusB [Mycoplasma sp. 1018B]